jgi:hypothetical protein
VHVINALGDDDGPSFARRCVGERVRVASVVLRFARSESICHHKSILTSREGIVLHCYDIPMALAVATKMLTLVGYNVQLYVQGSFGMSISDLASSRLKRYGFRHHVFSTPSPLSDLRFNRGYMALRLPIELVLNIMTCSLPNAPDAILNAAHPTTKLLLSFSLVCRETRRLAVRYLAQHCVCLDSRFERLDYYLQAALTQPALQRVTSLSLAPFGTNIHDWGVCCSVRELLCCTCETLKKLVIDIPLRSITPSRDRLGLRPVLREGFERLVNLEEFVNIQDELSLDVTEREQAFVWRKWPKLKRMALGGASLEPTFWRQVALHSSLEILFVTSPDEIRSYDPKAEYLKHTTRPLRFVVLTTPSWRVERSDYFWECNWDSLDPTNRMSVQEYLLPYCLEGGTVRSAPRRQKEFVRRAAEDGSLFKWEGKQILQPVQP